MADNLVLIVDQNDQPIGAATKSEIWAKGLAHRIVHVIIQDNDGRFLLQKRAHTMRLWPNCWTVSASGHVDAGEDYNTAATRETEEELGIGASLALQEIGHFYSSGEFEAKKLNRFNKVYRAIIDPLQTPLTLQRAEVSETAWFTRHEVEELIHDHPEKITRSLPKIIELIAHI